MQMRGQDHLENMRRRGHVPESVDICLYAVKPWVTEDWADWYPQHAALQADKPDRAALRCIVGLDVNVRGDDERRVSAMHSACVAAGARRVVSTLYEVRDDVPDYERWKVVAVIDTAGVLTWHR